MEAQLFKTDIVINKTISKNPFLNISEPSRLKRDIRAERALKFSRTPCMSSANVAIIEGENGAEFTFHTFFRHGITPLLRSKS